MGSFCQLIIFPAEVTSRRLGLTRYMYLFRVHDLIMIRYFNGKLLFLVGKNKSAHVMINNI